MSQDSAPYRRRCQLQARAYTRTGTWAIIESIAPSRRLSLPLHACVKTALAVDSTGSRQRWQKTQRPLQAVPACWPLPGEAGTSIWKLSLHCQSALKGPCAPLVHRYHYGSRAHPLHWGGADSAPGVDATVKEAPTPGCGLAVDTWAIIEDITSFSAWLVSCCTTRCHHLLR